MILRLREVKWLAQVEQKKMPGNHADKAFNKPDPKIQG